jgi:hypothetical protein
MHYNLLKKGDISVIMAWLFGKLKRDHGGGI